MQDHPVVSAQAWRKARLALLEREKAFTRERDALSAARRDLPWVQLEKDYQLLTVDGPRTLGDLFGGSSQLIVYHFMFGPEWEEGCPSCSFWADNYNGTVAHLQARDASFAVISRAPLDKLQAYKSRMGWEFEWVSSLDSDFNFDFSVSFKASDCAPTEPNYNFDTVVFGGEEAPGLSVFYRDDAGKIFHTYSCYARGLDMLNGAYQHLDVLPKGRDEDELPFTMAWLRRHDKYES